MVSTRDSAPVSPSPVPGPPGPAAPAPVTGCTEALFKEARRRRRRRRLAVLGASLIVVAVAIGFGAIRAGRLPGSPGARTGPEGTAPGAGIAPGTSVAWVDYNGRLHVGNLTAGTQHVVATINANPAVPLTQGGSHIYWPGRSGVIREIDLASGRIRDAGRGQAAFPAADGRHVFISRTDTSFVEVPATGTAAPHEHPLRVPPGWFVPYGLGVSVGNGILVQSADRGTDPRHRTVGVWNPRSGKVRVVGRNHRVIDVASPPGIGGGLLAWLPWGCAPGRDCRLRITSAQTLATTTVRSPLRHGFAVGGEAFSPDGRWLAAFVNLTGDAHTGQLAVVNTRTGTLRLVPGARTDMGEPRTWAQWLPDGRHLIAGGIDSGYLVDAPTMTAGQLAFIRGAAHDGEDVNYSAVIVPSRR